MLYGCLLLLTLGLGFVACAQKPSAAKAHIPVQVTQLSPAAPYQEALRPLTVTRGSVANWSLTEQAALKVAIAQAGRACELRAVKEYSGEALVDLGRLCSMGQEFAIAV